MPAVPALSKAWLDPHYYAEVALESTGALQLASSFVALKNGLKAVTNGWTCRGSSDSVSFNMSGTDLLVDKTKIVSSASGNRSWIVLRNVDGLEICVSFNGATNNLITVAMSVSAGFTGGALNARPTATDEDVVLSAAEWAFGSANVGRLHLHVMHTVDGKNTYAFLMYHSLVVSVWLLGGVSDAVSGWTPRIAYVDGNANLTSTTLQNYTRMFQASRVIGHCAAGTLAMRTTLRGSSQNELATTMANRESNTGNWQVWTMGLACVTSGRIGRHARLTDVWRVPAGVPTGWIYQAPDKSFSVINLGGFLVQYSVGMPPRTV